MDQLWDSDFVLPWVDGGPTWINYEIYSVLNFLLENWRKKTSRWSVFSFSSSLLNQLIDIPWCVFSLYIYPSRHFDAVLFSLSLVRAGPAYESIPYASEKKKKNPLRVPDFTSVSEIRSRRHFVQGVWDYGPISCRSCSRRTTQGS